MRELGPIKIITITTLHLGRLSEAYNTQYIHPKGEQRNIPAELIFHQYSNGRENVYCLVLANNFYLSKIRLVESRHLARMASEEENLGMYEAGNDESNKRQFNGKITQLYFLSVCNKLSTLLGIRSHFRRTNSSWREETL